MQKISKNPIFLKLFFLPVFLCLITFIVYYPSLNYPFQFDDGPNILKFYDIRNLDFQTLAFSNCRWICTLLNKFNFYIGKFDPFIYRIFNLTFHICTGILIFFFFYIALSGLQKKSFFKSNAISISFFTALLFLLHPVQTQTVSYIIQGRLEGIATLFIMLICLLFLIFIKIKNIYIKTLIGILLISLTILSTGTKEIAIVLPFLIFITDWFFGSQASFDKLKKRLPLHLLILFLTFSFYIFLLKPKFFSDLIGLKFTVNNNIGNVLTKNINDKITPWYFFISQFKVILHYLFIFIWPFNICVEYDWKLNYSFFDLAVFVPFLIIIGIILINLYLFKKNKLNPIIFGFVWFFIAILPRSTIIPSSELLADYKTYLASVGWLFIITSGILKFYFYLSNKFFKRSSNLVILTFILIPLLGFLTYHRNLVWRSTLEFWSDVIKKSEKSRAYNNYGIELSNLSRFKESIPYFKKAIKLDPYYWDPYTNLASVYAVEGKMDLAIKTLTDSLELNRYQPEAYNNLGTFLMFKKDFASAEKSFTAALAMVPTYGKATLNFGRLYLMQSKLEEAWQYFKKACTQTDFDMNIEAFQFYANTSLQLKKYDDAIFAFNKILELTPKNQQLINETLFNLGISYFLSNKIHQAIAVYQQMIKSFPNDYRGWCNLVECYMAINKFELALEIIKKAQLNKIYFEGMEIQQAKILIAMGYNDMAKKILNEFIKNTKNEKIKNIALELWSHIA